jgi:hypothetical protein
MNWVVLPARALYKVSWTLINVGKKTWDSGVEIVWIDGNKIGVERQYSFVKDVKVGQSSSPVITILTPRQPGRYRSVWGLRVLKTGHLFCTFTVKIVVQ